LNIEQPNGRRLAALALGAVGVVYGDIGTSPLYTIKEVFGAHGVALDRLDAVFFTVVTAYYVVIALS